MKWTTILLIVTMLCSIGIVSAENITLFTDADTEAAQKTWADSGAGQVLALFFMMFQYTIFVIPTLIIMAAILLRAMNKMEAHKTMVIGLLVIVLLLLGLNLYHAVVLSMIPDISTIEL